MATLSGPWKFLEIWYGDQRQALDLRVMARRGTARAEVHAVAIQALRELVNAADEGLLEPQTLQAGG